VQPVLRAPLRFIAENGEPVHAPVVLATIGAIHTDVLRGTVAAVGPDPATPVLWQVAQLARGASGPSPAV
jgi:hypothetical protein